MEIMGKAIKDEYEVLMMEYDIHRREVMNRLCNMKRIRRAKKLKEYKEMFKNKLKCKK